MKIYYVDAPEAWRYGCAMQVTPLEVIQQGTEAVAEWLIRHGYPEYLAQEPYFKYYRIIERDTED